MKQTYPNLFVPGAGKSGTTTLHELLHFHPDICMSSVKEPHYWTNPNFESYTKQDLKDYESLFVSGNDVIYKGESSTGYMQFPNFIQRIKSHYKNPPKFIFLLRNPIDRCYSHYWWLKGMGSETSDLKTAVLNDYDIEPSHDTKLPEANYKSYFQFGLYSKWLERFYSEFNSKDIKIISFEDLTENRLETMNSCFNFLNLSPLDDLPEIYSNKTQLLKYPFLYKTAKLITFNRIKLPQFIKDIIPEKTKFFIRKHLMNMVLTFTKSNNSYPEISIEDRQFLQKHYSDDVMRLKQITGLDFSEWTDFNNK